jgi:hypothetical protein
MAPPQRRVWWTRLLGSLGAGLGNALLVAIALTVVDLYQAGHGRLLLNRPGWMWRGWVCTSAEPTPYACSPGSSGQRSYGAELRQGVPEGKDGPRTLVGPISTVDDPGVPTRVASLQAGVALRLLR